VDLREGEHALYEGRPAWRALLGFYLWGLLLAAVGAVVLWLATSPAVGVLVGVAIAAIIVIVGYLRRLSTKYLITSRRLRISRGILRRKVQETRLDRVQNVNYDQTVIDRALRVGTVDFDTAGSDDSEFRFEWVTHPERVVRAVHDATEEAADHRPGTGV
jgi:uncharacterized membrane protein YdbT with pleckstrin-like domain